MLTRLDRPRGRTLFPTAFLTAALTAALLGNTAPAALAQKPVSLRLSYWGSERDAMFRRVLLAYARAVRRASGGKVRIQLFPGGLLGRGRANQINMLNREVADIVAAVPWDRPEIFREDGLFGVPGVIPNSVEGSVAAWRVVQKGKLAGYDRYHALAVFVSAPHTLHWKEVVKGPKTLISRTVAATPGPQYTFLEVLGARGTRIALRRISDTVDQNYVDGGFAPAAWLARANGDELLTWHVVFPAGATTIGIFMLQEKFAALPAFAQQVLRQEGGEKLARIYGRIADADDRAQLARWRRNKKHRVIDVSGGAAEAWVEAARKAISRWTGKSSRNARLMQMLVEALKN